MDQFEIRDDDFAVQVESDGETDTLVLLRADDEVVELAWAAPDSPPNALLIVGKALASHYSLNFFDAR